MSLIDVLGIAAFMYLWGLVTGFWIRKEIEQAPLVEDDSPKELADHMHDVKPPANSHTDVLTEVKKPTPMIIDFRDARGVISHQIINPN